MERLEKKIDQLAATQPDPVNENYIAEYVTGKVGEMFADVNEGPFSGLIAVLSQFEAVLTDSTKSESNCEDVIMKRYIARLTPCSHTRASSLGPSPPYIVVQWSPNASSTKLHLSCSMP